MDGKPVRLREVGGFEVYPAFHEVGDEGDITGEAIQFSYDQDRFMLAAELEGCDEGWTIVALSALDFEDLFHQSPIATIEEPGDGGSLRFEAQAACSLACR